MRRRRLLRPLHGGFAPAPTAQAQTGYPSGGARTGRRELLQVGAAAVVGLGITACATPRGTEADAGKTAEPAGPTPRASMSVLILGGTGFLGPHIVDVARARGHKVTLFNRGKTRPHLFPELEKLRGDRDGDLSALNGREFDLVIDTSGYVPKQVDRAIAALGKIGRYVFISSISVYQDSPDPMTEDNPLLVLENPESTNIMQDYGALKAACEAAATRALGDRALVIRPGLIVGPGDPTDRFTYWPVRIARGGEVIAPGAATDKVQWIDVRDLSRACITFSEDARSGTVNAVCTPVGMGVLLDACIRGTQSNATLRWVDAATLEKFEVQPWSDMPVWIPSDAPMAGMSQSSNARATAMGMEYRHIDDTIAATWAWWQLLPEERRALRAGIKPERETEVLAALAGGKSVAG